ncbi:MAG TPA: two-component system response regulator [Bacteroidetes bacterium]|nr:two-component system response regulator [Bacteroidota bacterium]
MKKNIYSTGILVVEDDPHDLELTLRSISKCDPGIQTTIARDGVEALEYLFGSNSNDNESQKNIPRLIIMDLKLPKVSGLEVIKKIKSHNAARTIPIVVFSSSTQEEDILAAYRNGANSYLSKPVKYEEYSQIIVSATNYWLKQNQFSFV